MYCMYCRRPLSYYRCPYSPMNNQQHYMEHQQASSYYNEMLQEEGSKSTNHNGQRLTTSEINAEQSAHWSSPEPSEYAKQFDSWTK